MAKITLEWPDLDCDRGSNLPLRCRVERAIVADVIARLGAVGWMPASVTDEECARGERKTLNARSMMEALFSQDDATLTFRKGGSSRWMKIVLGNGVSCVSDYDYTAGDFADTLDELPDYEAIYGEVS